MWYVNLGITWVKEFTYDNFKPNNYSKPKSKMADHRKWWYLAYLQVFALKLIKYEEFSSHLKLQRGWVSRGWKFKIFNLNSGLRLTPVICRFHSGFLAESHVFFFKPLEKIYFEQLSRGKPSSKAQFDYAQALVRTKHKEHTREGISLLEGKQAFNNYNGYTELFLFKWWRPKVFFSLKLS